MRTPRRLQPAIRIREVSVDSACPVQYWREIFPAKTPREWLEWSNTCTRYDGAKSSRGRSTLLRIDETQDRECREACGRTAGTLGRVRGESVEGRLRDQYPWFRLRPSFASASLYPPCPALPCTFMNSQTDVGFLRTRAVTYALKRDRIPGPGNRPDATTSAVLIRVYRLSNSSPCCPSSSPPSTDIRDPIKSAQHSGIACNNECTRSSASERSPRVHARGHHPATSRRSPRHRLAAER